MDMLDDDPLAYTQGGLPHLMDYLWERYMRFLRREIAKRAKQRLPTLSIDEAVKRAPALSFKIWATEHLRACRIVENFPLDANHGVKLSNNVAVSICPGIDIRGTMQDSSDAIPITNTSDKRGRRQYGDGIPII